MRTAISRSRSPGRSLGGLSALMLLLVSCAHAAHAGSIYWTDATEIPPGSSGLYRASTASGTPEFLVPSSSSTGIAYDPVGRKIYWAERIGDEQIRRSNLEGSNVETVIATGVDMRGIAVDPVGGKIYWTNGITQIRRANLDGSQVEVIFDGSPDQITWDLAVDPAGGKIYWSTLDRDSIRRADLDGRSSRRTTKPPEA